MQTTPFDESEITGYEDQMHGRRIMLCTSNFFAYFAGKDGKSQFTCLVEQLDIMDVVYGDRYPGDTTASDRRMNSTNRQFLREVDEAAIEIQGSLEKVKEVVNAWRNDFRNEVRAKEAFEILMPIYRNLRLKGYSVRDLQR